MAVRIVMAVIGILCVAIPISFAQDAGVGRDTNSEMEMPMEDADGVASDDFMHSVMHEEAVNQEMTDTDTLDEIDQEAGVSASGETAIVSPAVAATPKSGNVTLDFREADIRNVLRILAYKSGVNIVPSPEVAGLVTIQLTDVPWEEALRVILETYGFGYDRKDNIIVVTTIENLKKRREDAQLLAEQEPLATRTFILNFAKAGEVVATVDKMKTARGSVNFDTRTNTIIIRDTKSNLSLIAEVMPTLDATTPQILIEAK